jgi:hypothetical protein
VLAGVVKGRIASDGNSSFVVTFLTNHRGSFLVIGERVPIFKFTLFLLFLSIKNEEPECMED